MRPIHLALIVLTSLTSRALADEPPAGVYRMAVDSTLNIAAGPDKQVLRAQVEFDYRLEREGRKVAAIVDQFTLTSTLGGREVSHAEMGHDGMVSRTNGKTQTIKPADAPPQLRSVLAQFGQPLAILTVDDEGAETAREPRFKGGLLDGANLVENTRVFHPRFARVEDAWDAPIGFPLGQKKVARGTLHYAKRAPTGADPKAPVVVDVSGTIPLSGPFNGAEIQEGSYVVKGNQTYDPALGDWSAGTLDVAMKVKATDPNGRAMTFEGPVKMTMSRREAPAVKP